MFTLKSQKAEEKHRNGGMESLHLDAIFSIFSRRRTENFASSSIDNETRSTRINADVTVEEIDRDALGRKRERGSGDLRKKFCEAKKHRNALFSLITSSSGDSLKIGESGFVEVDDRVRKRLPGGRTRLKNSQQQTTRQRLGLAIQDLLTNAFDQRLIKMEA